MRTAASHWLVAAGLLVALLVALAPPASASSSAQEAVLPQNVTKPADLRAEAANPRRHGAAAQQARLAVRACKWEGDWCVAGSQTNDCCSGFSCTPVLDRCYPIKRQLKQPCLKGNPKHDCDRSQNLTCDDIYKVCLPYPRQEGQSCSSTAPCVAPMTCETASKKCVLPGRQRNDKCKPLDYPCDAAMGLTCHGTRMECFAFPRQEDDPCTDEKGVYNETLYKCAPGLACEVGITEECQTMGDTVGAPCHATRPCMGGLECVPYIQACYSKPRQEDQPCMAEGECAPGLQCDTGDTGTCVRFSQYYERCHATRKCAAGLSCAPGHQRCFSVPREVDEPCVPALGANFSCRPGLVCDSSTSMTCTLPALEGQSCWATRPCKEANDAGAKLYCEPTDSICYASPRQRGQPCGSGPGQTCASPLACHPDYKRCVDKSGWGGTCDGQALPCADTPEDPLGCQAGFQVCASSPRGWNEPCAAGNTIETCGPDLKCGGEKYPYCMSV